MVEFEVLIIESVSIVLFLGIIALILFTILTRFKGMKRPPFWMYIFIGFLLITFHGVLSVLIQSFPFLPASVISITRLIGNLMIFIGFYKMYKVHSSSIKFDKSA